MTSPPPSPALFGFLLFPGFPMACLTSAIEPLRAANEITGRREFSWRLIGEQEAPVRASADVGFDPDMRLDDAQGLDYLMLLSSPTSTFTDPRHANARLRLLARSGVILGGFSGGIFPLVRSGVMAGYACSVHWCYDAAFKAEFPEIEPSRSVIVRDRRRYTASGAAAVFDLMLRLIEERLGRDTMNADQKVPVATRGGTDDLLPDPVRAAVRIFSDHIEDTVQISDVAAALAISDRHLDRLFKQVTGQSPLKYYRLMRLKKARQRVLYSTQSIAEIAQSVGYASSTPMTRHYAEAFGMNPNDERRRLTGLRGLGGAEAPE